MAGNFFDQFDSTEPKPGGNFFDQFDAAPAASAPKQNKGLIGDLGTDFKRGLLNIPSAGVGLLDIPIAAVTGERYASRAADALGEATGFQPGKWADDAQAEYSPQRRAGSEAIERAWQDGKAADIAGAYLSNPGNIAGLVAESIPSMVAGGLIGRAALAGAARLAPGAAAAPLAPVVAGAAGEGAMIAGQTMENINEDVDASRAAAAAAGAGLVGTALGVGGGALARRLGAVDPETAIAGGMAATGRNPLGFARRIGGGAVAEGLFEEMPQSISEQGFQNFAEGNPLSEGMARAAVEGTIAGGLMGAGANVMPARGQQQTPPPPAIDPNAGPLSKAASMAQNANASILAQQQQLADEEGGQIAGEDPRIAAAQQAQSLQARAQADAQAAERARMAEIAAMQDTAADEIAGATGFDDQADTVEFNRFVGSEAQELEGRRARAADQARMERSVLRGEIRDARDQLVAEGAFEADRRAQARQQYEADAVPFERIAPDDYDTLNPVRAGQGEVLDPERAPTRALRGPDRAESLQAPEQRQAIEFRPQPGEPLRATPDGEVGTRQQFEDMAETRGTRREQMRRAREQARFVNAEARTRAARTVLFNEATAERTATALSNSRQEPYTVVPHPAQADRFAVVPARSVIQGEANALQEEGRRSSAEAVTPNVPTAQSLATQAQEAGGQEGAQETRDSLIARFDAAEVFSDEQSELIDKLYERTLAEVPAMVERGEMPVFETGASTFMTISPSTQQPGKVQVTLYNKNGVSGDTQYDSVDDAIRGERLFSNRILSQEEANARFAESLKAEAEYQARAKERPATAQRFGQATPDQPQAQQPDKNQFRDATKMVAKRKAPARKPDAATTERAQRNAEDLRAMSQDAGWAEIGGRLIRDADGNVSRTKWIPRAQWFHTGMESRPDVLAQHIDAAARGEWIPVKSQRTIEGMMEWLDAQRNQPATLDEDASMYDFEAAGYDELSTPARTVVDMFDDIEPMTQQDEAAAMRALGFTEQEIQDAVGQTQAGAGSVSEPVTAGAQEDGAGNQEAGRAQAEAGQEEVTTVPVYQQTFNQWLEQKWSASRYQDAYIENADGDVQQAKYAAVSGGGKSEAAARNAYWAELIRSPRDADVSIEMYDGLTDAQKYDASRHFFKMDDVVRDRLMQRAERSNAESERIEREVIGPMKAELDRLQGMNERTKSGTDAWNQRAKEAGQLEYQIAQLRAGRMTVSELPEKWRNDRKDAQGDRAKPAQPDAPNLRQAVQILLDRTDGNGSPDGLTGADNQSARKQIMALLNGGKPDDYSNLKASVLEVEKALHKAAGIEGGTLRDRRGRFLDWMDARQAGEQAEPLTLETYTPAEIAQREAEQQERADAEAKAERDAAAKQRQDEERAEVRRRSEAAADTFELGGDAMANLTGQGDIFSQPAPQDARALAAANAPQAVELDLRAKSRETERDGDVGVVMGNGDVRFVSLADAAAAARSEIANGTPATPFQIHNATGIRIGDAQRVIDAAQQPTQTPKAPEQSRPAPSQRSESAQPNKRMTDADLEKRILIAADSVAKLRKVDVERVLTQGNIDAQQLADYIKRKRTDLAAEVDDVMAEVVAQRAADKPRKSFAGSNAETADMYRLIDAKERIEKGEDAERVRRETGWFRGIDGRWRFEISDDEAQLSKTDGFVAGEEYVLANLLDHPKLFAAYPDIRNMTVSFVIGQSYGGQYDPVADSINIDVYRGFDERGPMSILMHEIQHAIQQREGFALGGAPDPAFTRRVKDALSSLDAQERTRVENWKWREGYQAVNKAELTSEAARYALMYESAQRLMNYANNDKPSSVFRLLRNEMQWIYAEEFRGNAEARDLQLAFYDIPKPSRMRARNIFLRDMASRAADLLKSNIPDQLLNEFRGDERTTKSMVAALRRQADRASKDLAPLKALERTARNAAEVKKAHEYAGPHQVYSALAGEVEARNTQTRLAMTDAERRAKSPLATADIPADQIIVMFGGMDIRAPMAAMRAQDGNAEGSALTRSTLRSAIISRFPSLSKPLDAMLKRGDEGKRGGVVVVEDAAKMAEVFAQKTGRTIDDAVKSLGSTDGRGVNGLFDPKSGLTFLVAPNLTAETAPAVLLHEATHGKQRAEIDRKAMKLIETRQTRAKPLRDFLFRVEQRMEDAGESGNATEAASYIVEMAVSEGRQAGFSAVDGKLMNWIDAAIGKPIGDMVRDFVAMVRAWALRKGISFTPTVDDLVAIAKANVRDMARGDVTGGSADGKMQSMSERNRVASEQAPNPAGDGMTGGATTLITSIHPKLGTRVPVRVVSSPDERWMRLSIEEGQATLRINPVFAFDRQYVRTQMANGYAVDDFLWPFGNDVYIRTSDNAKDFDHIKAGTHRGSKNHSTNETEDGLSVSRQPAHAAGKYAYLVRGKPIGQGSDGEPLLDVSSVQVASERMPLSEAISMLDAAINGRANELGLSAKELRALKTATDLDFSRMNEPTAPNGPGALQSRASQTASKAFRDWFGASKVVDENGKPLVMYHGTSHDKDFSKFKIGARGAWFTSSNEVASDYAENNDTIGAKYNPDTRRYEPVHAASRVLPVYLKIERPYKLTEDDARRVNVSNYAKAQRELFAEIKAKGYDGILWNAGLNKEWVALGGPEQIKSATGNNGDFDPANPDIRFSRAPSTIAAAWDAPEPSKMDDLIYTLQNKQIDMKRVVDAVKEKVGQIEDQWNPYLQEELFHGRSAKGVRDFLANEMRPLLADMRRNGVDMAEFEKFLHARHAPEANAHIAKINPNEPDLQDGGSGMTNKEAADHLASIAPDRRRVLDNLAKQIDTINANTRKVMVDSGLETAETIKTWEAAYKNYVPLQREDVEAGGLGIGQGFSVRGPASKRRTGSKKAVIDILANIALQREKTIVRAEKNKVAQANYALAIKAPNPDFWMPVNPDEAKAFTPAQQAKMAAELVSMGLDPADAQNFVKEPVQRYVDPRTGLVAERINPVLRGADNVLALRIDGKDRYVFFNRKDDRAQRMVHALKNLDADQLGHVFGALAKVTRFFAAVNTQWNPIFGVVNLTRDTQAAMLQLSTTKIRGSEGAVVKNVLPAMRGIYAALRAERSGKPLPNSKWAQAFEEFRNEGGQTGYRDMFSNSQERADALASELNPERWMDSPLGKIFTANGALRVPLSVAQKRASGLFNWLTDYNDTLENSVRLSAYMEAKAKGLSNQEAASIAKNLMNFNRKGQIATQAGALYAFFNAAMQGTTRMLETLKGPAGRKIILGGLTLGAMQAVALAAAGFDDDEPPQFVRERSIIIPLGDGKYASVPMPLGFHAIPSMSRIMTEWAMSGFRDTTKRFGDIAALFAETFNPIGSAGWSMQTLSPTALDPIAALAENRDWTGKPIAQEDFNSLRPTPGYSRAKDTASELSKAIAYWTNLASGGTDYKPGLLSPTPDQIDYLIGQVTGGVGREYLKAEQSAMSVWTGEELPPHKIPLLGRFYGNTTGQSSEATRFYNNLREINLHRAEVEGRRKDGGDVMGYLRDNPVARLGAAGPIQIESQVRKLRQAKRDAVERNDTARVKALDEIITAAMRKFNERVAALEQ